MTLLQQIKQIADKYTYIGPPLSKEEFDIVYELAKEVNELVKNYKIK